MNTRFDFDSREQALTLDLAEALTSSLELPEVFSRAHAPLARLLQADYMALCISKPDRPLEYDWVVAEKLRVFFNHYPEMAPMDFVRDLAMSQPNVVLRDMEMLPREELVRSPLYQHCRQRGLPLEHVMAVLLDMRQEWHGGLTLYRERALPFSQRDQALLQRLTPLLAGTLRNCRLLGEVRAHGQLLEALFHHQGAEFIVLTPTFTEDLRSPGATRLLESWFSPSERGPKGLPQALLERLGGFAHLGLLPDTWERSGTDRNLKVTFIRLPAQDGRRLWALMLQEVPLPLPLAWRQKLTRRELEVAGGVLQGWDNQLIADELRCAQGTVKKHVTHIFRKLGVENRAALMALAARSPTPSLQRPQ